MNLGTRNTSVPIGELVRKYSIPHRTSLVRMIDKMNLRTQQQRGGCCRRSTRQIDTRRCHEDSERTRRLETGFEQAASELRGRFEAETQSTEPRRAACSRCRSMKISCNGSPCSNCVLAGESCLKDETTMAMVVTPEPPVSNLKGVVGCSFAALQTSDPMRPSVGGMVMP